MGSKTRLSSYCTKRGNNGVNLVTSRKINTRLARPITEQAAEPMESGKYMWSCSCVKKYKTTVKKYCYVFYFNIFNLLFHCYILPVRPHQKPLLAQSISPHIYNQILVPLRHLHTDAKPKFITAMDRCFNARHYIPAIPCPLLKH